MSDNWDEVSLKSERDAGEASLSMTVSKGYYVRSLARDLGTRLGEAPHDVGNLLHAPAGLRSFSDRPRGAL